MRVSYRRPARCVRLLITRIPVAGFHNVKQSMLPNASHVTPTEAYDQVRRNASFEAFVRDPAAFFQDRTITRLL